MTEKTIHVDEKTHNALYRLKTADESYNDIIVRLITSYADLIQEHDILEGK